MHKSCIEISYDGRCYSGWQIQPNAPSIQEEIERALTTFLGSKTRLIGAGRTDAGVHARGQHAHFTSEQVIDYERTLLALNGLLPHEIRIHKVLPVPATFHAQYSACGKIYHYNIWSEHIIDPFVRHFRTHVRHKLNMPLLKEACTKFIGEHDFTTFANVGSSVKTSVRHITRLDCIEQAGGFRLEFEGTGFLYKMVRNIVGVLLDIATGRICIDEIDQLFAAKDRRAIGMSASPTGLFLMNVLYPEREMKEHAQIASCAPISPAPLFPIVL